MLTKLVSKFSEIKNQFPDSIDGVLTDREPKRIYLNNYGFTLEDCIKLLGRDNKIQAIQSFSKYPIDNIASDLDIDNLIAENNRIFIDGKEYDGLNIRIAHDIGGILFTFPLHSDLGKNWLEISYDLGSQVRKLNVPNLYGSDENCSFLLGVLEVRQQEALTGFEKFIQKIGETKYKPSLKGNFNGLLPASQLLLIEKVDGAMNRNGPTKFYPDGDLIKEVYRSRSNNFSICELRIKSLVPIRMYFSEFQGHVYLASILKKPSKKQQSEDIKNAHSVIERLISDS